MYACSVTWLIHVCDVTHSHMSNLTSEEKRQNGTAYMSAVWHDSFMCVWWLIHVWDVTHSYVWHDSCICVTCVNHGSDMTHSHMRKLTRGDETVCNWYGIYVCSVTWLIHSYVRHASIMCVTWLIHMCDVTHEDETAWKLIRVECLQCDTIHSHVWNDSCSYVWHDSFVCVWLDAFSCVWHDASCHTHENASCVIFCVHAKLLQESPRRGNKGSKKTGKVGTGLPWGFWLPTRVLRTIWEREREREREREATGGERDRKRRRVRYRIGSFVTNIIIHINWCTSLYVRPK